MTLFGNDTDMLNKTRLMVQLINSRIEQIAKKFALMSGLVLLGLVILTTVSVIGRSINSFGLGPIPGDFELVEHGGAFVVFWALPWCQMRYGHIGVDSLTRHLPYLLNGVIAMASQLALFVMSVFVARQLGLGLLDKMNWGETSFILQLPVWWGYAAALPGAWLWVATTVVTSCETAARLKQKAPLL